MPPEKSPTEKPRKRLSVIEKVEIITYYKETKCSVRKLAKIFNIGKTQACLILKKEETLLKLLKFDDGDNNTGRLRPNSVGYQIDRLVYHWYTEKKHENFPVTGPMIQSKALDCAKEMGNSEFKASNGWLSRFLRRHNIVFNPNLKVRQEKEIKSINNKQIENLDLSYINEWQKYLAPILPKYSAGDIFSAVQTGLFYKALPNNSAELMNETCSCGELSTERFTILFCCSMSGTKEKPLVIANVEEGKFIKWKESEVDCMLDENAWITQNIITEWLEEIDYRMGKNKRKILLFLNHAVPHSDCQLKNIQIIYFPPCFSYENEPINQKIIQNFKIIYRQQLLKHLIELKDNEENGILPDLSISESQAINWISMAWKELSDGIIQKCFQELGFNSLVNDVKVCNNEISASLTNVSYLLYAFDSDVNAIDYVSIDNDLVTENIEPVEILVDTDTVKYITSNTEEKIDIDPKQELAIKSYDEALQSLKDLQQFYVVQNDLNCALLVKQLISYNEITANSNAVGNNECFSEL